MRPRGSPPYPELPRRGRRSPAGRRHGRSSGSASARSATGRQGSRARRADRELWHPERRREVAGAEDQRLRACACRRDLLDRDQAWRALDLKLEPDAAFEPEICLELGKQVIDEVDVAALSTFGTTMQSSARPAPSTIWTMSRKHQRVDTALTRTARVGATHSCSHRALDDAGPGRVVLLERSNRVLEVEEDQSAGNVAAFASIFWLEPGTERQLRRSRLSLERPWPSRNASSTRADAAAHERIGTRPER